MPSAVIKRKQKALHDKVLLQDFCHSTESLKMASTSFMGSSGRNVSGLPPVAPNLASSLPQLTSETELQKLLADERMRSQMHKTNYEQLKEEHKRYAWSLEHRRICS